ncbi:MAG: SCP2 sterol-binding domain-containing protein [Candidatus Helarchaeota archaeon]
MAEEPDRKFWRSLADATKSEEAESVEELPKAEDLVEGPLPETEEEALERQRKLEAARKAEEAKRAEEARRLAQLKLEEEAMKQREEEARKRIEEATRRNFEEEERRRMEEEAKKLEELQKKPVPTPPPISESKIPEAPPSPEPSPVPEQENLLLVGLVNLLQPTLDLKLEQKRYQRWIKSWDKIIAVNIVDEGHVYVEIKNNQMKAVLGKPPREPDIVIEGEYETITNYLNGELDPILMFFDFVLLRKARLVRGLEIKLSSLLSGNLFKQARDLYRIDKILKIK